MGLVRLLFRRLLLDGKESKRCSALALCGSDCRIARAPRCAWLASIRRSNKMTARAAIAAAVSFVLARAIRPAADRLAALAVSRADQKSPRPASTELHAGKQSTPTMGGLFIVAGIVGSTLLLADLANPLVCAGAAADRWPWPALGAVDDLAKLRTRGPRTVGPRQACRPNRDRRCRRPWRSTSCIATRPALSICICRWPASTWRWDSGLFRWPCWCWSGRRTP